MKPIIEVKNVSKKYRVGQQQTYQTLRDALSNVFQQPFGKDKATKLQKNEFWALRNLNLEILPGEVIGIIGRNGAGKSTLLKILSRITPPTTGQITMRGRVGGLLEVGTGFHQELTGRENIYLNGTILGMKRLEITSKFAEIVDFAGIEKFIDTPVKHYSSGMYTRLAFAIAAHLEPEILLVDEVLAVGDMKFQEKCLQKMNSISKNGKTIFFVSHNMAAIENLCTRAVLLDCGRVLSQGNVTKVIKKYIQTNVQLSSNGVQSGPITLTLQTVTTAGANQNTFQTGKSLIIKVALTTNRALKEVDLGVGIEDNFGSRICTFHTQYQLKQRFTIQKKSEVTIRWDEIILMPGSYQLLAAVYEKGSLIAHWENIMPLHVIEGDFFQTGKLPDPLHQGKILVKSTWQITSDGHAI